MFVVKYKYGFRYYDKIYCWKEKRLYRMPFNSHLRWHGVKKLKIVINGKTAGYCIDRKFKSIKSLKDLTEVVNYELIIPYGV